MATEIRFAFALNGGVSLAIWIGGVVDEVLRLVDAGKRVANGETHDDANPYVALCHDLEVIPKVDVLAGSSAGGLNAACLGIAIVHGTPNLNPVKRLWVDHGSFDRLLRLPTDRSLVSVLSGDEYFLPHIVEGLASLAKNGTGWTDVDPPITVRLTATSLPGRVTTIGDGHGAISSVDHRAEFVFHNEDFDFESDERAVERVARACRSTASFPGAFEPSSVPADLYHEGQAIGLFDGASSAAIPVVDGAVLVNLPAEAAIEAIINQPSRERIERVLALVVPDPGDFQVHGDAAPTLNQVLSKSIVGIPRTQSLTDFIQVLNEHNLEVRSRRAAREAMLAQFAGLDARSAWVELTGVAGSLFHAYQATRIAISLDKMRLGLPARLPAGAPPVDLSTLEAIDPRVPPWVPNELALGTDEWCWGGGPVRRLSAVLITWINTVAAVATPEVERALYAVKEKVSIARADADRIAPGTSELEVRFVEELARPGADVAVAFERASQRWPCDDPKQASVDIAAINHQMVVLAECLSEFIKVARSTIEQPPDGVPNPKAFVGLRGLVRIFDGTAHALTYITKLLLCVEVIEATFAGTEPRPDQEIRLVQFTSKGAVAIDPLQRSVPMDKLAGVELAHFGAFLKRSWRANDWMWGRLDAAQRLVALLDTTLGGRLTKEGTLHQHMCTVQAAVLREELPDILTEIEADKKEGARVSPEGKAFSAAVRTLANTPEGPVDLSHVDEAHIQELFGLQLVGSENLQKEVGSDLATMTSVMALATTMGVVRAQGPRLLRGPVRLLGASSSLAWRIARRRRGRRLRILEGALVIVIGLMGLIGTFVGVFTDVDLGAFRYFAWSFLLLAPVLAVFAAPWMLVAVGRRVMSRMKSH